MAHGMRTELQRMILVAPDYFFEQVAERQFKFCTVVELDIGTDNGCCLPTSTHGIQVTAHTNISAKILADANISIATIGRGVDIRTHSWSNHHFVGIVVAKGMQGDRFAEAIANRSAKAELRKKISLPRHPVFIDVARHREVPAAYLLLQRHATYLRIHQSRHLTGSTVKVQRRPTPEIEARHALFVQLCKGLHRRILHFHQ